MNLIILFFKVKLQRFKFKLKLAAAQDELLEASVIIQRATTSASFFVHKQNIGGKIKEMEEVKV